MTPSASVGTDGALRLFLALRLPDDVRDALAAWSRRHLRTGRMVAPENLHITLAFLGTRPAGEVPDLVDTLREAAAGVAAPRLTVEHWRETRSVGMVTLADPTGRATLLADDLHARLERLGAYRREPRPWLPHVTVLRFRERPRLDPPLPDVRTFVPSDAAAYLSRLHPSGARYEVLESVPLHRRTEDTVGRSNR